VTPIKFFLLKDQKDVIIDSDNVTIKTLNNGHKAIEAFDLESRAKLLRFLSEKELKLFK